MRRRKTRRDQRHDTLYIGDITTGGDGTKSEEEISEDDMVKITEKHLDGLTKLLAIPIPLISAVVVALATGGAGPIKVIDLEIPRHYAEYAARAFLILVFAQCCTHLIILVSMTRRRNSSDKVRRALAWHPGALNPFFIVPHNLNNFFKFTLIMGRSARLTI
jgi:hypothetical protein